jgi:hypothetical protein
VIHAKFVLPRVFPHNSARQPEQIDRIQDIGGDLTLGREKEHEIGRVGILGYRPGTPAEAYTMKQHESGDMKFWRALANKEDPISTGADNSVNLDELKITTFDIAAYLTDDSDVFRGTIWFPNLRVNGFSLNIADPDAILERNFNLIGEDYKIIDENYLAYQEEIVSATGISSKDIVLSPDAINYASEESPKYILKVLRIRGLKCDVIDEGTDEDDTRSFVEGTQTLTVRTCEDGDLIKVFYVNADAPYTDLWTDHDEPSYTDFLTADSCEVFMKVGTSEISNLQSVGIDITFARTDYKEIGNDSIVLRGAKSQVVKISLNRYAEDITLERILAGNDNILIDPRDFVNNIQLIIKVYADKTKEDFKIGYLMKNISPTTLGLTQAVEDYMKKTNTLETDELLISDDETEIVFA